MVPFAAGVIESLLAKLRDRGLAAVLARGAAGSLVVAGAGSLLAVAVQAVLARAMGAAAYGVFHYAVTVAQVVVLAAIVGLDTTAVRFLASYRVEERWALLAGFRRFSERTSVLAALGVGLAMALVVLVLSSRLEASLQRTLWLACLVLPPMALVNVRRGLLQGLRRVMMAQTSEGLMRNAVLGAGAALLLVTAGALRAETAMLVYLVASLAAALLAGEFLRRAVPAPARTVVAPEMRRREWLRVSLPLLLVNGMRLLLHQTDILLIGALVGTTEAGIYGVSSRLSRLISYGLVGANAIAAPLIAELHVERRQAELQRIVTLTSWGATAASLAAATVLVLAGERVLGQFGDAFRAGLTTLVLLSAGELVNAATGPVGNLLNMTGHQDANARILAWITVANAVLAAPAILRWGVVGAACVTGALTAVKNIWTWWVVRQALGINSSILPMPLRTLEEAP